MTTPGSVSWAIGSLFSGVGGLELGLEQAGLGPVLWQVEQDSFCRGVLAAHWPKADRSVTDVRRAGAATLARVDVLCGGFPCQDVSVAGLGAGLAGARSGLWREFARVARELRPRAVVVENVAALVTRGLDEVLSDLEGMGYRCSARILRASDAGAPHRRERLFVVGVADADGGRREGEWLADVERLEGASGRLAHGRGGPLADDHGAPLRHAKQRKSRRRAERLPNEGGAELGVPVRGGGGLSESDVGRSLDGISPRVDRWPAGPGHAPALWEPPRTVTARAPTWALRLQALGNAVVPACARVVGAYVALELNEPTPLNVSPFPPTEPPHAFPS